VTSEQERQSALWMQLAQGGDQAAYASLLVMLTSVTRRFTRARVGNVGWVDDVVQETLLTIHRARHTYDPARPFAPWFYAIASNRLIDVLRREQRVRAREIADDALPESPSEAVNESDIDVKAIHAALATLPSRQRDVIVGMKFRDESVREIAGRTHMTESAVRVTAHRGYRTLRRLLGGRHDD
jgi:RNA polymerase sigma-70 factor (ECF subfamily)